MVVGMGDDPSLEEYEKLLQSMKVTAQKEPILLRPDKSVVPGSTREWLGVGPICSLQRTAVPHATEPTLDPPTSSCRASGECSVDLTYLTC